MEYTQIREDTFETLAMNAGVLLRDFDIENNTYSKSDIIASTTGGINFKATPSFKDFGEDIDNCPKNMKELMKLDDWEITLSGTFVTADTPAAQLLIGLADLGNDGNGKIVPRADVDAENDFVDLWFCVDYGNVNTGSNPGHCVIHMMNAFSTGGFQIQTTDKEKGKFSFEFKAHYSIDAQDTVPFEVYIKKGTSASDVPTIRLGRQVANVDVGGTVKLTPARLVPDDATITWSSSDTDTATVSAGTVTGVAAGNTIITASITVSGVTYADTCTVIVTSE